MIPLLFGIFRGRRQFFTHGCQKKCKQKIILGFPLAYGNAGREIGFCAVSFKMPFRLSLHETKPFYFFFCFSSFFLLKGFKEGYS
jgi:hypothetical protein